MQKIFFVSFFILSLFSPIFTQTCINSLTDAQRTEIVRIHNVFRNQVASGTQVADTLTNLVLPQASNMKAIVWDSELEALAQNWANTVPKGHNPSRTIPSYPSDYIGENIYWSSKSSSAKLTPGNWNGSLGVNSWFKEVQYWNGDVTNFGSQTTTKVVGHFTQVVWAESTRVGCGYLDCVTPPAAGSTMYSQKVTFVCDYWNGGNYLGEAIYQVGTPCSGCGGVCSSTFNFLCSA